MRAAALGHQYLAVKTNNGNDIYFGGSGRFYGSRKYQRLFVKSKHNEEQDGSITATTEPLSRRVTTVDKSWTPSVTIYKRSVSDSDTPSVLYEHKPTDKHGYQNLDENHKPHALVSILSKRRGSQDDDDLSRGVRKFYKKQDELIDSLEQLHKNSLNESDPENNKLKKQKRRIDWMIRSTLVFNCSLLIAKIIAAVFSKSLSIISSVVDSAVDSASACLLFWAIHAIKKRDPYAYPGGRTRLEPLIIVILSVIMVSASVQVIFESTKSLISDVNHFTKNSTELSKIEMGPLPITVMCVTIVIKAILSFLCFQISNPTMRALGQDHLNDVFSNIVALVCGTIASKALDGSIKKTEVAVIDPIGAILISLYIIFCWLKQLREQVRNLSGYAAEPEFLQKITWLALHHSPAIQKIDTVRAFHFGLSFLVEVELILPESMSLKEARHIGTSLQDKLERIPEVELAFVHLDYTVDPLKY